MSKIDKKSAIHRLQRLFDIANKELGGYWMRTTEDGEEICDGVFGKGWALIRGKDNWIMTYDGSNQQVGNLLELIYYSSGLLELEKEVA